jgi:hypothetical protein
MKADQFLKMRRALESGRLLISDPDALGEAEALRHVLAVKIDEAFVRLRYPPDDPPDDPADYAETLPLHIAAADETGKPAA